ncbi:type VI secretion system membrane subunit TssM [Massilia sp. CCM 8695]|uniref:Type VI secretion system membrane subunit TssM n=1 Tax=Massilia frigida TaxID=2609281 RepID=A0ABX0NGU4_9BURK|nr:type VI secretion system membrane subunit TssM [Massilia frigida]NHZ82087.1 type VI secretion system membrane subunit TssM [Massilia frigida]
MKRLLRFLVSPAGLALIALVLVGVLIWTQAPLLAFNGAVPFASARSRALAIVALLAAWLVWLGVRWGRAALARRAQASPPEPGQLAAEADRRLLAQRLRAALALGRKGRGRWAAPLPSYVLLGGPGSGKTSMLEQSGLTMALAQARAGRTLAPTARCEWRVNGAALLLDTPGHYSTDDGAAWAGVLDLLRRKRRQCPLGGVIVVLSAAAMLAQGAAARRTQAHAIRARVDELQRQLGVVVPLYVVVSKCDLLPGFGAWFDALGEHDRTQVWGMSFPLGAEAAGVDAGARFGALEHQIRSRLIERMQGEGDDTRRALLFGFPQQFSALGDALHAFLDEAFQPSEFGDELMLRGAYFASAAPADAGFGPGARSYFLTRLLRDLVFQESGLKAHSAARARRRRLHGRIALAASALILLAGTAGLARSFTGNRAYVQQAARQAVQAQRAARAVVAADRTLQAPLALLDAVGTVPDAGAGIPPLMRLGLYQGERLGAAADQAYRRLLRSALLPRVQERMETELRRGAAQDSAAQDSAAQDSAAQDSAAQDSAAQESEARYDLLRAYLMLGQPRQRDPLALRGWAERHLDGAAPAARHLAALFSARTLDGASVRLDPQLIAATRQSLDALPLSERVYKRLRQAPALAGLPDLDLAALGGPGLSQVLVRRSGLPFTRGIGGMYTVAGNTAFLGLLDQAVAAEAADGWVLERREAGLKAAVLRLYADDYIAQWDALLADIALAPVDSVDAAVRSLNALAGSESPLRKLLQAAATQTRLAGAGRGVATPAAGFALQQVVRMTSTRVQAALSAAPAPLAATPPAHPVDLHFARLQRLLAAGADKVSEFERLMESLKQASAELAAVGLAQQSGQPMPDGPALAGLRQQGEGLPTPMAALLMTAHASAAGLTLDNEHARLNALWQAGPAQLCRSAIEGRYPLVRGASVDASAEDFGNFYGAGGLVDSFFTTHLAPHVETGSGRWRLRAGASSRLGLSQAVLDEFQRAARIRDTWFADGGTRVAMRFSLRPLDADPALARAVLDIEGQVLSHGTAATGAAMRFQVLGGKGSEQVRLLAGAAAGSGLHTEGSWAWLHMLDLGRLEKTAQADRFQLSFDIDGLAFRYELKASSVNNPFRREIVEASRCLTRL